MDACIQINSGSGMYLVSVGALTGAAKKETWPLYCDLSPGEGGIGFLAVWKTSQRSRLTDTRTVNGKSRARLLFPESPADRAAAVRHISLSAPNFVLLPSFIEILLPVIKMLKRRQLPPQMQKCDKNNSS